MIPRCFPTTYVTTNGTTKMVVNKLASTTGLKAWVDYIPTKKLGSEPAQKNTYSTGMLLDVLVSNIYEDASLTKAWSTDVGGYIPTWY